MPETIPVRLRTATDVLEAVPRILSYHPENSLVVLCVGSAPVRAMRYELPDDDLRRSWIAGHLVFVLAQGHVQRVLCVGYGPGQLVTPLVDRLLPALETAGIKVNDMLRAENGRYWSYLCHDTSCCGPDGKPFDAHAGVKAAELAAEGLVAYPSREARRDALLSAPQGAEATAVQEALDRAVTRMQAVIAGQENAGAALYREARKTVADTIDLYRKGGTASPTVLAFIAVTMGDLPVRDDAWSRMVPGEGREKEHVRMWLDVMRYSFVNGVPGVACLLAFAAWQAGDGGLANLAIDRAQEFAPGYSLARLISGAMERAIPPGKAVCPMTPEEVAAEYGLETV